jgi:two-component system CheB/CheR fusion protein
MLMADNDKISEDSAPAEASQVSRKPVIVGIGASAGGVRALQDLFEALPETTGAAFVVVVHLDPETRSELSSILGAQTRMPVVQVGAAQEVCADHVYVIPPDRRLHITDSDIAAAEFDEPRGRRAPIDLFFRSLAEQHGDGFAIILTGAGSDGAVGVRAVKEAGGVILVQDPNEAEYSSMPRSAIATGVADFVLPVREIATRLVELIRTKSSLSVADPGGSEDDLLRRVLAHVRVRIGHDFSKYKRSTVLRRIARRMQVTRATNLQQYYDFLRQDSGEAEALFGDLLISVTRFFRDNEAFDALRVNVLPHLFSYKQPSESIRVWVPGCATGEEAYTIAIILEEAARHQTRLPFQVFGSDLDDRALAIAREGCFPTAIEADVSDERLRRFFRREGDHYRVRQHLRDLVLFASHDLLKDPPFSRIDLVSCRNLLIYLDRELQQQACRIFYYALNRNGFLFLGPSETAADPPGLFRSIDRKGRIYQSIDNPGDKPQLLPHLLVGMAGREHGRQQIRQLGPGAALSEAAVHRQVLEMLAPPSILVDDTQRVVHLSENAGRYLQPSGGPLSGDVVDLARPELRFELRSALHRAFGNRRSTLSMPILVSFNGVPHLVQIQVKPAAENDKERPRNAVVLFIEGDSVEHTPAGDGAFVHEEGALGETIRRLRHELQLTQTRLRTMSEESEAANEELRAANEELQSMNEEYRSTAEELETSKEELQSVNEELQTVNTELKLKLEAVSRAHSDLQNLMAATNFGTLFLDADLRIKRFTQQVTEVFNINPSDAGRPITDFTHRLEYGNLIEDARDVLTQLTPLRREARSQDGRWYDISLRPYRTVDDRIDGVVITFVDVTERRWVEEALRESERLLRQEKRLVDLSRDPIFIWDFDDGVVEWNRGSEELYGYTREEALGKRKDHLLATSVPGFSFDQVRAKLLADGSWSGELRHRTKTGRELTVESRIVLESTNGRRLALEGTRDITERKQWEQRQNLLMQELTHRVKNTLAVVQAIARQSLRNSPSSEDFVERFEGRLMALASTHNLLVQSDWQGADLAALVRSQLEPYASNDADRLRMDGKSLLLAADLATPFGLVLHELATNAAKYGSLSSPSGTVNVSWSLHSQDDHRLLNLVWYEKNGPPAAKSKRTGFGSALIERGIPNATVRREFRPEGLVCTIQLVLPD